MINWFDRLCPLIKEANIFLKPTIDDWGAQLAQIDHWLILALSVLEFIVMIKFSVEALPKQ